jgi:hypothetical protein
MSVRYTQGKNDRSRSAAARLTTIFFISQSVNGFDPEKQGQYKG